MQNSIQSVNISGFSEAACRATSAIFGTETTSTLNLESFTAPSGGADGYAIYINDSNSFTAPSNGDEPTADLSWNGSGQQPVYFGTFSITRYYCYRFRSRNHLLLPSLCV